MTTRHSHCHVEASRATTAEEFADQFASAMKTHRRRLIEAVI
jgi:hypothetical protein